MANLNKVMLIGNLTKDPELRHTAQGAAVASFSIAVNRSFKGSDGDWKKEVSFFNIVVWGKAGENCAKFLAKGRPVLVEGRLQNRSYETNDGQKRTVTEIVADNVQFLAASEKSETSGNAFEDAGFSETSGNAFEDAGFSETSDAEGSGMPF